MGCSFCSGRSGKSDRTVWQRYDKYITGFCGCQYFDGKIWLQNQRGKTSDSGHTVVLYGDSLYGDGTFITAQNHWERGYKYLLDNSGGQLCFYQPVYLGV